MSQTNDAASNKTPAIEFRDVSLSFDGTPALSHINFKLERGEMICITGASGSGKSVLLLLAMGLLRADEGQIFIHGRDIELLGEDELLAIRGGSMGMVFQEDALFTGLTVYDNVAFRPSEHGWSEEETRRAVNDVLRFVGLEAEGEKFPEELSGGMRRRLEIARALIGWPSIMLYDEPTSSLDPLMAGQVLDLIIRARDIYQISSLYVTKELHEIPYLLAHRAFKSETGEVLICEEEGEDQAPQMKVMLLEKGEIVFTGTHEEFVTSKMPAVEYITHAKYRAHYEDLRLPDPWSKKRTVRSKIL